MSGRRWFLLALVATAALPAAAQPTPIDPADMLRNRVRRANDQAVVESRRAENGAVEETPRSPGIAILAGRDASSAKLTLSPREGDRWSASITTPIRKGDPTTDFLTLRGLAEDVELAFAVHEQGFDPVDVDAIDVEGTFERQERICVSLGLPKECDAAQIEGRVEPARTRQVILDFESIVTRDGRVVAISKAFPVHRWEIGGSVGRTKRSYFTDEAKEEDEDRLSASFGGSYGRLISSTLWKLDARWQRKYEPQTAARRCLPVDGTSLERCKDLSLGRAVEKDLFPISLEARWWSGSSERAGWAISPRLVYEVEEGVWGGSLPLYLVPDAGGNLAGGVVVDWQEGKDTVVSVFVSAPLSMFF